MTSSTGANLVRLSDTGRTVADPAADVRGRDVVDVHGDEVGRVDDLLVDDEEGRVQMLRVERGGFLGIGAERFLVPVAAVTEVTADAVRIDRERSRLTDVPGYDPDIEDVADGYDGYYGWWGFAPMGAPGYLYPPFPR
jgi:sporulation protein YlmC with PRC-barrel domain